MCGVLVLSTGSGRFMSFILVLSPLDICNFIYQYIVSEFYLSYENVLFGFFFFFLNLLLY